MMLAFISCNDSSTTVKGDTVGSIDNALGSVVAYHAIAKDGGATVSSVTRVYLADTPSGDVYEVLRTDKEEGLTLS